MLKYFIILSFLMAIMSFVMFDPIKSSFFLIFSLLLLMPLLSFCGYMWFSYFICLLFLSGIFVILVYFSSLSKLLFISSNLLLLLIFFCYLNFYYNNYDFNMLNLHIFYLYVYIYIFMFILMMLIFFMNFSSYFLNFSGALRKF